MDPVTPRSLQRQGTRTHEGLTEADGQLSHLIEITNKSVKSVKSF